MKLVRPSSLLSFSPVYEVWWSKFRCWPALSCPLRFTQVGKFTFKSMKNRLKNTIIFFRSKTGIHLHKIFPKEISKERLRILRFNFFFHPHKFFLRDISKERLRILRFKILFIYTKFFLKKYQRKG